MDQPGWDSGTESPAERREAAFNQIVSQYGPMVSRIAGGYEYDPDHRLELIQEILFAVWKALPSYRGEASLKTFVAAIARRRAIDHVAQAARRRKNSAVEASFTEDRLPDMIAEEADSARRLRAAISRLKAPYRDAVLLLLEGFSCPQIAAALGITVNAANLRCRRAKFELRRMLKGRA